MISRASRSTGDVGLTYRWAAQFNRKEPREQAFVELGDVLLDQMAAVLDG